MGGRLIREILREGRGKLGAARQLVLSPHTDVPAVRRTLHELDFGIRDEAVIQEDGKFYTVISAVPEALPLTEEEFLYGPVLLRKRPPAFLRQLRQRLRKEEEILLKIRDSEREDSAAAAAVHEREAERLRGILGTDVSEDGSL